MCVTTEVWCFHFEAWLFMSVFTIIYIPINNHITLLKSAFPLAVSWIQTSNHSNITVNIEYSNHKDECLL